MKVEVSASVCCSCDAVRMSVEKGVTVAVASKAGLRGPRGREVKKQTEISAGGRRDGAAARAGTPILLLRLT
ncbi:hypothetical protein GCM10010264_28920 [Streptomyces globisporus]|nr:hypothetical protein GCM10010264_28920 [Streptomyces globisporus]